MGLLIATPLCIVWPCSPEPLCALLTSRFPPNLAIAHVAMGFYWRAIQAAWRFAARPPCWLDTVGLTEASTPWMTVVSEALQVFQTLGWEGFADGRTLRRKDDLDHVRVHHFGWESVHTLHQWLVDAHQLKGIHQCRRVKTSLHRHDPACARAGRTGSGASCALATGVTAWYWGQRKKTPNDATSHCICNAQWVSCLKADWSSASSPEAKTASGSQVTIANPPTPSKELPSLAIRRVPFLERTFLQWSAKSHMSSSCASTGGARGHSAMAAANSLSAARSFGASRPARREAVRGQFHVRWGRLRLAMLTLFRGLRQLSSTCLGDVCMVYDCEAVAAGIRCPAASSLPAIFDEIACAKAELSSNGLNFNVVWVP